MSGACEELEGILSRIAGLYREIPVCLDSSDFDTATELDAERGELVRRVLGEKKEMGHELRARLLKSFQAMQEELMTKAVEARRRVEVEAASEQRQGRAAGDYLATAGDRS